MNFKGFRITARALIIEQDKLLCVSDDGEIWYTPGGRLEPNESLTFCLEREVFEETGLVVKAGPLVFTHEGLDLKDSMHKLHHYFLASIVKGCLSKDWKDEGGTVLYRQFFSLKEIQTNNNIYPRFLAEGEWCQVPNTLRIYKGCNYVRGCQTLNAATFTMDPQTLDPQLEKQILSL